MANPINEYLEGSSTDLYLQFPAHKKYITLVNET